MPSTTINLDLGFTQTQHDDGSWEYQLRVGDREAVASVIVSADLAADKGPLSMREALKLLFEALSNA